VIAMSDWGDVVTTALLGTNRRPVPDGLPGDWATTTEAVDSAIAVLELAARHRAWSRAGTRLAVADPPVLGPPVGAVAPADAQELLGRMLDRPRPTVINAWLAGSVSREWVVGPDHWAPLAELASRTVAYDRKLLAGALGPRGRWFLEQNPAWRRLAAQLAAAMTEPEASDASVADAEALTSLFQQTGLFAADLGAIFS
jgi:hypothetical protein